MLTKTDIGCARLRHGSVEPDRTQPADLRQRLPYCQRDAGASVECLDDARDRRSYRHHATRASAAFDASNQGG